MNGYVLCVTLPFPPTVNRYWRCAGRRVLISAAGRLYRREVVAMMPDEVLGLFEPGARLSVLIRLCAPEHFGARAWDLDNRLKGLLDALTHAGVWHDDSLIDELHVIREGQKEEGRADVLVWEVSRTSPVEGPWQR